MGSIRTVVVASVVDLALVDAVPEMLEIVKVVIYPRLLLVGGLASGKAIRLSGVPVESARRESKAFHVRELGHYRSRCPDGHPGVNLG